MNIYIDESGSMTHETILPQNRYFTMALILTQEPDKLRRVYKRFVQKYLKELKDGNSDNKMFTGENFLELKGSAFTPKMKKNFVDFICKNNLFQILYIKIDNTQATANLYKNKARAFNYILKLAIEFLYNREILTDRNLTLNLDERNVKTEARHQLKEHLCTEFSTGRNIVDEVQVEYFDSCNNKLIQLADVFSNILYSNLLTSGKYDAEIKSMADNGYLVGVFKFPPV
ncbi:uncharacterized protein DUF3800 [Desulfitobacterium sp. LBE]|uniref:GP21 protein n=3 Tax=root TaxID=1 RepID=A0A098B654_DESHA|nr:MULTISPECIES: DUF3800 domain-containing protein [Desulfitobacterium]ACL22392.1 GP21 protein [Desulfitobacterium hafniense DCB-2]MEA5023939.1 DUF3800 domain-containing protein [Desulfitobacterium hafniense]TWH59825.1 uncharacterized protein DUF3800 [Desulfitobacterium sp. LBE]CDX03356.1 GP21 protein [Desulfitobacterium hafniense]